MISRRLFESFYSIPPFLADEFIGWGKAIIENSESAIDAIVDKTGLDHEVILDAVVDFHYSLGDTEQAINIYSAIPAKYLTKQLGLLYLKLRSSSPRARKAELDKDWEAWNRNYPVSDDMGLSSSVKPPSSHEKLIIVFIIESYDLRFGSCIIPLLENFDMPGCEFVLIAQELYGMPDYLSKSKSGHFLMLPKESLADLEPVIERIRPHIIVGLDSPLSFPSYSLSLLRENYPATYIAYHEDVLPNNVDYADYIFSTPRRIAEEECSIFSGEVRYLSAGIFDACDVGNNLSGAVEANMDHPETFYFASFHPTCRLNDATLRLWMALLAACPNSKLILGHEMAFSFHFENRLSRAMSEVNLDPERVISKKFVSSDPFCHPWDQINCLLGTLPHTPDQFRHLAHVKGVCQLSLVTPDAHYTEGLETLLTPDFLGGFLAKSEADFIEKGRMLVEDSSFFLGARRQLLQACPESILYQPKTFAKFFERDISAIWEEVKERVA